MLAKLKTFTLVGIEAPPVEVEVDVSPSGLPKQVHLGINPRKQETATANEKLTREGGGIDIDIVAERLA